MAFSWTDRKKNSFFWVLLGGAILLAVLEAVLMVLYRESWVDEVFSAFKSYLYLSGELVPFQGSLFEYPPMVIPTYGLVHYLFGPSLYAARILSAVFFFISLALLFFILKRHAGRFPALIGVFIILSNLLLVGNYLSATMYSLASALALGVVFVEGSGMSRKNKTIIAVVLIGVAILTRTNMVALALGYLIYLLVMKVERKMIAGFLLGTIGVVVIGYLPIILPNPSLSLAHIVSPFGYVGPLQDLPVSLKVGGVSMGRFLEVLTAFFKEYFGILLLFFTFTFYVLYDRRSALFEFIRANAVYTITVILSLVFVASHYFYFRITSNVYYANYFIPLLVIGTVLSAFLFLEKERLPKVLLVALVVLNLGTNAYRTDVISSPSEESDLKRTRRGAEFVGRTIPEGARVLAFDNSIIHIFLADRRTYMPLMNRDFLFMPNADTESIQSLGFYNMAMLKGWAKESEYLVLHKERWPGSFIRSPFWGTGSEDIPKEIKEIQTIFDREFVLVGETLNVYPRKYTDGNDGGTMQIYKRIE